jgi:alpha/beta superfamily hydrolase
MAMTLLLLASATFAAESGETVKLETEKGALEGTLLVPAEIKAPPVALIIAGSGPTDRDGNNAQMKTNTLKMLAEGMLDNGIGSLRYDKRGIGQSSGAAIAEEDLRFENLIDDVKGWIAFLEKQDRFGDLVVIAHSQGSLLGMVASQGTGVDRFISIAGLGQSVDLVLKVQLAAQPPQVLELAAPIIDQLAQGQTVSDVPPILNSLFRPSVQPFLISYMKYDPQVEIAKLKIPLLIIQGTTDIQVSLEDAWMLAEAKPDAKLRTIEGMSHVLKAGPADRIKNMETYNQPDLPIMPEVVEAIVGFIAGDD